MKELSVTFQSRGQQVVGMLHLPEAAVPCPAVLMLHGFTGSKSEARRLFVQTARALAREGIASLRFDFRGSGDSAGEFHEMSLSSELEDARVALAWLQARPEVDVSRIGVLGMSLGGLVAALLLAHVQVRAAVLWCPVTNPRRVVASRTTPEAQQQLGERAMFDMDGWAVGRQFVMEMMAADPLPVLQATKVPLLFIHGDADETVPHEDSAAAVDALKLSGRDVELQTIAGSGHCYESLPWIAQLLPLTTNWLRARLCAE